MILLKFEEVTEEVLEGLENILAEQEVADLDPGEGEEDEATDLDPDTAAFEGSGEEMMDHVEERLGELRRIAREFAEPLGGDPRIFYEVQQTSLEGGRDPALRICLVLESPASPDKRLYFCDTIARLGRDYYLSWDLPGSPGDARDSE